MVLRTVLAFIYKAWDPSRHEKYLSIIFPFPLLFTPPPPFVLRRVKWVAVITDNVRKNKSQCIFDVILEAA
jgi:hypothetical protein